MRVTGIGGGHGLAATLAAARAYADAIDAVVTVADDGGSSGRLSRDLGIPPPGDIRNCLVALAADDRQARLFQHRFAGGALTGHTVGNLVIAALAEMRGDFIAAVDEAAALVGATGRVHPATAALVSLRARVRGGEVRGQAAVARSEHPIEEVLLDPADPPANESAVAAIRDADQVVLGPGSLFTSLLATAIVPGIRAALVETKARRVYVCNVRAEKGETAGLSASGHLAALTAHVGRCVDTIVVQAPARGSHGVEVDRGLLARMDVDVVEADVATDRGGHDVARLGAVLSGLARAAT